ncbi:MAG TPA: tetratricopeptide repeat protein [Gemmataceae bacterium]|nr:tetratricopeptide repeat protein [Gemmataceae bacterium]
MRLHFTLRFVLAFLFVAAFHLLARGDTVGDYLQKGRRALMNKQADKAVELAGKAIALDPKDARGYLLRGSAYEALRQHDKAITDFTRCLERDPQCAAAYDQRGSEQFILGHIKESLDDFDKFLELQPKAAPGHWKRGISLYYARRYKDGRKQFKAGDRIFADDVENAVWHFLCNAKIQGIDKARAEMLKIGTDKRVPLMKIYDLFLGKCKPADVLAAAEAGDVPADLRKQQFFYAHLYLGLYYDALGDKRKALEHMNLAAGQYRLGYMGDVAHVHAELLRTEVKK